MSKGKDIRCVGDDTAMQTPTVIMKSYCWKWVSKKVILDVVMVEGFYANEANASRLWTPPTGSHMNTAHGLQLIYLPAECVFLFYRAMNTL